MPAANHALPKMEHDVVTSAVICSAWVCGLTISKKLFDKFIIIFLNSITGGQTFFKDPNFGNAKRWAIFFNNE